MLAPSLVLNDVANLARLAARPLELERLRPKSEDAAYMANHLQYPYDEYDRRQQYDDLYRPMMRQYDYVDPAWRRPSTEQYEVPYSLPVDSPMQSLPSSSSNSTGIPASPQPAGLVAVDPPDPAPAPSGTNPGQRTYAFVSLAGSTIRKRPRRRYDEIERLYSCSFEDCTKAYGTLNHLNAHVTMQKHGPKRNPSEFKELRKLWRNQKKAEQQMASRRKRRVGDDEPGRLARTASATYSSPGYTDDSDDGTPQPVDPQYPVDAMWAQSVPQEIPDPRYEHPLQYPHMGAVMPADDVLDRIPPNATLLQSLPPTHPSQSLPHQQFSGSMHHPIPAYGTMPLSNTGPPLLRRASDQGYDYHPHHRGPAGPGPGPGPAGTYSR